jgi:NAD(P)H-flavin reductase
VSKEMVAAFLPPPQESAGRFKILVCGPPGMMKAVRTSSRVAVAAGRW